MGPRQHTGGPNRRPDVSRPPSDSALIVFAKAPVPGQVKTRLCPPLTPDEAASLHGSIVLDMLERSRGAVSMDRFVACAPSPEHVFFKILEERHGVRLLAQTGDDLGARMARAMADVFALGYRQVLVIGTDLPTLPGSAFGDAVKLLADHDLVLGPAMDGGYYLIGLRKPAPDLFAGIPWSTDRVLALTTQKAAALGLTIALLPVRRDIDTIDDLRALIDEMGASRGTGGKRATRVPQVTREIRPEPRTSSSELSTLHLSPRTAGVLRLLESRLHAQTQRTPEAGKAAASR
jgi:rSAM/selenodomain-associated transferase 1